MSAPTTSLPKLKDFLPEQPPRTYPPVGKCIYCGATENLSDEHIIPLGLGGRYVLPEASCPQCSRATSKYERTCLRTMYGPLRLLYDLPSRRRKDRPETLQLKIKKLATDDWTYTPVAQSRYPFLVTFPYLEMPRVLSGADFYSSPGPVTQRLWIRGASPNYDFDQLLRELVGDLSVHSIMPEARADVSAFCRLLAKVAHSYAAAELGVDSFSGCVSSFAVSGDLSHCLHYIGSQDPDAPATGALHELAILESIPDGPIMVKIRFLSKLGTPTYYVVVGQASRGAS